MVRLRSVDWYEVDKGLTVIAAAFMGFFGPVGIGFVVYQWASLYTQ